MEGKFGIFERLHKEGEMLVLPNAWNAASALTLKECNYKAVGTSSAAVAATLGYPDGEGMPFEDYLVIIRRIAQAVEVPVTVDMEMGFGKTLDQIYANIGKLLESGVVGINIEDSIVDQGARSLKEAREAVGTISGIKSMLKNSRHEMFVNVRCDTFLLKVKDCERETTRRMKLYEAAGADGIFLPFIHDERHIAEAVSATKLPLNVMAIPELPDLDRLAQLGVRRVSMGPFLQMKSYAALQDTAKTIIAYNSIKSLF